MVSYNQRLLRGSAGLRWIYRVLHSRLPLPILTSRLGHGSVKPRLPHYVQRRQST